MLKHFERFFLELYSTKTALQPNSSMQNNVPYKSYTHLPVLIVDTLDITFQNFIDSETIEELWLITLEHTTMENDENTDLIQIL